MQWRKKVQVQKSTASLRLLKEDPPSNQFCITAIGAVCCNCAPFKVSLKDVVQVGGDLGDCLSAELPAEASLLVACCWVSRWYTAATELLVSGNQEAEQLINKNLIYLAFQIGHGQMYQLSDLSRLDIFHQKTI